MDDAEAAAKLCGKVFAEDGGLAQLPPGPSRDVLVAIQGANAAQIESALLTEMQAALRAKDRAARDAREWRQYRRYTALKAEIAALRGRDASAFLAPPSPMERRQLERWQRQRQFAVLLAEDAATGRLLGSVTLSLTRCEAALPPPLPTSKPLRLYISNMVVDPEARRRGVATELLGACMRLGRRWQRDSAWLHVEERNSAGLGLYQAAGFRGVSSQRRWNSAFRKSRLMSRLLPPATRCKVSDGAAGQQGATVTGGSTRRADGVFIWETDI